MTMDTGTVRPFGVAPGTGEARWFLGALGTIKASTTTTGSTMSVMEFHAPEGHGSPLHVHRNEAEWWYVLDGELAVWADGTLIEAPTGAFVYGPADVPHTFSVVSAESRFLLGTVPAGFEGFLRAAGEPAAARTLPPPADAPPDPAVLAALAAEYGIEILGPPGIPA